MRADHVEKPICESDTLTVQFHRFVVEHIVGQRDKVAGGYRAVGHGDDLRRL
jgi:hypothetical protein